MPSSYTDNLRLEIQATGENRTTWGNKANSVFNLIEDSIAGYTSVAMADANVTLTTSNGSADQARSAYLNFTGNNTAVRTVTIPVVSKTYIIKNSVSNGHAITISNGTNSVNVANGAVVLLWTDGTLVTASTNLIAAYALTTDIDDLSGVTNAAGARTNLGLGTMATQAASGVAITGGTITGITDLAVADGGTGASDAATARTNLGLGSIATQASSSVSITGGSITGITDLAVADGGTGASDAATARTNLGLGSIATQASSSVSITGGTISSVTFSSAAATITGGSIAGVTSITTTGNFTMNGTTGTFTLAPTTGNPAMEIGRTNGSNTPVIDFHSGSTSVDYDSRLIASGGTGSSGGGTLSCTAATFACSADITAGGTITASSDMALKKDILDITSPLELVKAVTGKRFTRKANDQQGVGFIAQDIEKVLPELVGSNEHGKTVDYLGTIAVLWEAVKELAAKVEK